MTLAELQTYYADRLIIQYRLKTRARGTIEMIANLALCDGLMLVEPGCFDLDTAIGAQLTVLGRIVGVPRNVIGLDLAHEFFQYTTYAGTPAGLGFLRYADPTNPNNIFKRYYSDAAYTLSDFEMRTLIRIKIIFNTNYESYKNIIEAFWNLFGADIEVVDNKDMTVEYNVSSIYETIFTVAEFLDIVPRPMGVDAIINIV